MTKVCRRCVHLKTFGVGAAKTVAKTIKERQGIVYASGITEHGEARNGVEQELQLPEFIAEYEKYFLGGRMYVEVYSRREGGRLLSAGSTGRIAVLQMIDEDGRSAIFVPPGGPVGTESAEVVCVPFMEGCAEYDSCFAIDAATAWQSLLRMIRDASYPTRDSWFYL